MNNLIFLKGFWFNLVLFSFLVAALILCFIKYKKDQRPYRYYGIFFMGLIIIRIIQLFIHLFSPHSFLGILTTSVIVIILIFSFFNFYLGYKEEKKTK